MDPRYLESDEVQVELDIRDQDRNHPQGIGILMGMIEEELSGLRPVPHKVHSKFRSVNSELSELKLKNSSIFLNTGELDELAKCRSRLLHVYGRLCRLEPISGGRVDYVVQLKNIVDANLLGCTNMFTAKLAKGTAENIGTNLETEAERQALIVREQLLAAKSNQESVESESPPQDIVVVEPQREAIEGAGCTTVQKTLSATPAVKSGQPSSASTLPTPTPAPTNVLPNLEPLPVRPPVHPTGSATHLQQMPSMWGQNQSQLIPPPNLGFSSPQPSREAIPTSTITARQFSFEPPRREPQQSSFGYEPALPPRFAGSNARSTARPFFGQPAYALPELQPMQAGIPHGEHVPMSKWGLQFGGAPNDLPVEEFILRVETLARVYRVPQAALTVSILQLLTGTASSWYWTFIRNYPTATWPQARATLQRAFRRNASDEAIRRLIMDRLQLPSETFTQFQLAIEALELRLAERMTEQQLVDILRRNMLPHVQDKLLFHHINSLYDLQECVYQVEEHVQRQLELQPIRRPTHRIHELSAPPLAAEEFGVALPYNPPSIVAPPTSSGMVNWRSNPFGVQMDNPDQQYMPEQQEVNLICAIAPPQDRNQFVTCWNCDDLGHTFVDCAANRIIFCYGCGTKNVVRPQCPKCSLRLVQGNGQRSVRPIGNLQRPGGQPLQRPDLHRRPQ